VNVVERDCLNTWYLQRGGVICTGLPGKMLVQVTAHHCEFCTSMCEGDSAELVNGLLSTRPTTQVVDALGCCCRHPPASLRRLANWHTHTSLCLTPRPRDHGGHSVAAMKLIFFDNPGRGEVARVLLQLGEVEYHDVRISRCVWHLPTIRMP
jgi:hypothetical protein